MLQNAYFLAKIGADTAEKEQHFAEILPTDALWRLREEMAFPRDQRGGLAGPAPLLASAVAPESAGAAAAMDLGPI